MCYTLKLATHGHCAKAVRPRVVDDDVNYRCASERCDVWWRHRKQQQQQRHLAAVRLYYIRLPPLWRHIPGMSSDCVHLATRSWRSTERLNDKSNFITIIDFTRSQTTWSEAREAVGQQGHVPPQLWPRGGNVPPPLVWCQFIHTFSSFVLVHKAVKLIL